MEAIQNRVTVDVTIEVNTKSVLELTEIHLALVGGGNADVSLN
jgi:hypothetical protein